MDAAARAQEEPDGHRHQHQEHQPRLGQRHIRGHPAAGRGQHGVRRRRRPAASCSIDAIDFKPRPPSRVQPAQPAGPISPRRVSGRNARGRDRWRNARKFEHDRRRQQAVLRWSDERSESRPDRTTPAWEFRQTAASRLSAHDTQHDLKSRREPRARAEGTRAANRARRRSTRKAKNRAWAQTASGEDRVARPVPPAFHNAAASFPARSGPTPDARTTSAQRLR